MDFYSKWFNVTLKLFAAFGVVSLLFFLIAGLTSVLMGNPPLSLLSSLFSHFFLARESLSLTVSPQSVTSEEKFALSWVHKGKKDDGSYFLKFKCQDDIGLKLDSGEVVPCGANFRLASSSLVSLLPVSTADAPVRLEIELGFERAGEENIGLSANAAVAVRPKVKNSADKTKAEPARRTTPPVLTPGSPTVKVYPVSSPARVVPGGVPDLAISVVDTGIIRASNGEFAPASSTPPNTPTGIVFEVTNLGTAVSAKWNFVANLPIYDGYFVSDLQEPIAPGDKVRFTLGFSNLKNRGANTAVLTIDPQNELRDANRENDHAAAKIIRDY